MTDKTLIPDPAAPKPASDSTQPGVGSASSPAPGASARFAGGATARPSAADKTVKSPPDSTLPGASADKLSRAADSAASPSKSDATVFTTDSAGTTTASPAPGAESPASKVSSTGSHPSTSGAARSAASGESFVKADGHKPGASSTHASSSSGTGTASASGGSVPPAARPRQDAGGRNYAWLVIGLVLLCVALALALWYQRKEFVQSGMVVASRIDTLSQELTQSRNESREAMTLAQSQAGKVSALENAMRNAQAESRTLQQAWQDFNDTTNDGVLANDVERLLTIANQQLRLGGSVSNAIVALETAQSRLTRADRANFGEVQQAVTTDLDRLRAVPAVDVAAESARIERLSQLLSSAPLLVPDAHSNGVVPRTSPDAQSDTQPVPDTVDPQAGLPADAAWWQRWRAEIQSWPARAGSTLKHEMGDLIRVTRVDQPDALMLSSSQADQLRAGLRQRLQTMQLALLMRQPTVWKSELAVVQRTIADYFEPRSAETQAAIRLAESLAQTPVAIPLPEISESLNAMAGLRMQVSDSEDEGN